MVPWFTDYEAGHRTANSRSDGNTRLCSSAPAVCGFRTHASCRTLSPGWFHGEPRDAAEVDEQSGLVASAFPACEGRACMAGAKSLFWGTADAGQLSVPLVGGSGSGLPSHRADR